MSPVLYTTVMRPDSLRKEGGHSCPPKNDWPFLRPREAIVIHKNRLPHWQQAGVFYFVTWHLADSLPQNELNRWKEQRNSWLSLHPKPWDEATRVEYARQFNQRLEDWLDAGAGSCLLRNMRISEIISHVLMRFNDERYDIDLFVVMPNHVHVLFQLDPATPLDRTVKAWKGVSARSINRVIGCKGGLWTEDYWDTIIRNPEHLERCRRYLRQNPAKARLRSGEYRLYEKTGDRNVPGP